MYSEGTKFFNRTLLAVALALSFIAAATGEELKRKFGQEISVYKSPSCGCCQGWVDYLKTKGFRVETHNVEDVDRIKAEHGLTDPNLKSCHTAIVDGYVVEGHVPADDIWRLLTERPDVLGITAPGMPMMSPGMNSIEPQGFDVLSFDSEGATRVYSRY